jgi:hypothetical protein
VFRPLPRRFLPAALVLCLALVAGAASPVIADDEPLTDEDVVVMYVSGQTVASIIDKINGSPTAFDLSDDMLGELRSAGLPDELLQAMVDRQREIDGEPAPSAEPGDEDAGGNAPTLRLRLNPGQETARGEARPAIRVTDAVDPSTRELLRMRSEDPRFTDIAIALLCTTQDHVPDQWRSQTPLGRDFVNTPRHRLLAFVSGAKREEPGKLDKLATKLAAVTASGSAAAPAGVLALEIPEQIEVRIEPDVVHDLTLGVALQAEGRFYLVAADGPAEIIATLEGLTLDASIEGFENEPLSSLTVRFQTAPTTEDE